MSAIAQAIRNVLSAVNLLDYAPAWSPVRGFGGGAGYLGNYSTSSGESVNERTALLVSAHFACVRCKSEDLSVYPMEVFEIIEQDREMRKDDPVYRIFNRQFNPEMTAVCGLSTLLAHAIGFSKGVAEIEWTDGSRTTPRALWPLDPTQVEKVRLDGEIYHRVRMSDGRQPLIPDADVVEVLGPSYDGLVGYSIAELSRYAIGLAIAAQKFQGSFFGNGAWLGGVIEELPPAMKPEAMEMLRKSFSDRHQGAGKAFGVGIIPGGGKFKEVGIDPQRGQVSEILDFTVDDICRFHRVPPHKVQNYKNAHFANVEQGEIIYRADALLPLGTALEQEIARKLLPTNYGARINYNAHQRIDFKTQQEGLSIGRMWGIYSIDEARKKLGEDPIEGPYGEMRLIPANMIPIERAYEQRDQASTNAPPPKSKPDPSSLAEAFTPLVFEGLMRAANKECKAMERIAKKGAGHEGEINAFYETHRQYVAECAVPLLGSMARIHGGALVNAERVQVVGEVYLAEWSATRPGASGTIDESWVNDLAARWVNATLAALQSEAA